MSALAPDASDGATTPPRRVYRAEEVRHDGSIIELTVDEVAVVLIEDRPVAVPLSPRFAADVGFNVVDVDDELLLELGVLPRPDHPAPIPPAAPAPAPESDPRSSTLVEPTSGARFESAPIPAEGAIGVASTRAPSVPVQAHTDVATVSSETLAADGAQAMPDLAPAPAAAPVRVPVAVDTTAAAPRPLEDKRARPAPVLAPPSAPVQEPDMLARHDEAGTASDQVFPLQQLAESFEPARPFSVGAAARHQDATLDAQTWPEVERRHNDRSVTSEADRAAVDTAPELVARVIVPGLPQAGFTVVEPERGSSAAPSPAPPPTPEVPSVPLSSVPVEQPTAGASSSAVADASARVTWPPVPGTAPAAAPVFGSPVSDVPVFDVPVFDVPVVAAPGPVSDVPVFDVPVFDVPVVAAPGPVSDVPVFDVPVFDVPVVAAPGPVSDVPVFDVPVVAAPGPVSDVPVSDVPVVAQAPVDAPLADGHPEHDIVVRAVGVRRRLGGGTQLRIDELTLRAGEMLVVRGPERSGKTALCRTLSGFDAFDTGALAVVGHELHAISDDERAIRGGASLAFATATPDLVPDLSVVENTELALLVQDEDPDLARTAAAAELDALGLAALAGRRADTLARSEAVRVSLARALTGEPPLVVADDITIGLDDETVSDLLYRLLVAAFDGAAVVVTTTDPRVWHALVVERGASSASLVDGVLVADPAAAS